ncbi:MAG: M18 family aminopeptidase [Eubacteriales bacterium]|nr:M18 family aminopeptidase [Eubacteriales bacterium]
MSEQLTRELFAFIKESPTSFHAVEAMRRKLEQEGYSQLLESAEWELSAGGKYYVIRNGSALIAFRLPLGEPAGFQVMASHSDSPTFKIKENPEIEAEGHYVKLNVEKYGGMLCAPWFDRPLSVAGRLIVRKKGRLVSRLVNVDRDLVMIPNLAIHMNREANDGTKYNVQKDMLPLYGDETSKGGFMKQVAEAAGVDPKAVAGSDLFLYSRTPGSIWGAHGEYMSAGRLDDLQCAFASLKGFLEAKEGESIPVHCVFDNEEVGSGTRQGAASTFLRDTLANICDALGKNSAGCRRMTAQSMMLSADNGHGVHPNYGEKACPTNRPYLNGGVVIKYSANQKYTTDGIAAAMFKEICRRAEVPYQIYLNHSNILGGSTLGNISGTQVPLNTVDIGLALLAMHSPCETGGIKDTEYMVRAAREFYGISVKEEDYGVYRLLPRRDTNNQEG